MPATAISFSCLAREHKLAWPSCRCPMVGTKPMLPFRLLRSSCHFLISVTVFMTRKLPFFDGLGIILNRLAKQLRAVQELLDELRPEFGIESQQILKHQYLPVRRGPGADADGGDF